MSRATLNMIRTIVFVVPIGDHLAIGTGHHLLELREGGQHDQKHSDEEQVCAQRRALGERRLRLVRRCFGGCTSPA